MQKNNSISIRKNRFEGEKCRFEDEECGCLKIKKNFKSVHDEKNLFINFDKSYGTDVYKELRTIYKDYENKVDILEKYFIGDELLPDNRKINRLRSIFFEALGIEISYKDIINKVRKYKHKKIPRLQFYIYKEDNMELNLILVDIFHLAIPAKKNGKYIWENVYLQQKNNKIDLKDIIYK